MSYTCTYNEVQPTETGSAIGRLVEKRRKFSSFKDAVEFSRSITNRANLLGKPIIEEVN